MKILLILLSIFLFSNFSFCQSEVDSLLLLGVKYHDQGQFDKAIELFKEALMIDSNSIDVNCEIALSYLSKKDYSNAILHSNKVIKLNDTGQGVIQAYLIKGSALDYTGKTKESIKLFKEGLKKIGPNHLLFYNLGVDYYNLKEYDKAEEALLNAINVKKSHASSHLLLGTLMNDKNKKSQGMLCLYYFLYLEPNSERSKSAFKLLIKLSGLDLKKSKDNKIESTIQLDPNMSESEFGKIDFMLSLLQSINATKNNMSKMELFIENSRNFFNFLDEQKNNKYKGLWWDYYIPFFIDIEKSAFLDIFCYYISISSNTEAEKWIKDNSDIVKGFKNWLDDK
jgi:tetratricopeptide (TPR) repeat protein